MLSDSTDGGEMACLTLPGLTVLCDVCGENWQKLEARRTTDSLAIYDTLN